MHIHVFLAIVPNDYHWLVAFPIHGLEEIIELPLRPTWNQLADKIENTAIY
jgi:hypothetical protein